MEFLKDLDQISTENDSVNIEELITTAKELCEKLPLGYSRYLDELKDLEARLSYGEIRLAVMGQFKRGKSTFVNSLLGINILPVSVIPVTSIPTFIKFGQKTICTIRFFDNKPDLVVTDSITAINDALTKYVSEQNNPENRFHVRDAIIQCNSPVLTNGTILIDTPGFGSTYIHNTTTTVELIKGCDAVLFLLSADPPFTQTEVEFLKEVKRYVPQIFFIVNKIDQLSQDEISKLDPFLKNILTTKLSYPPDTTLFHVSARAANQAGLLSSQTPSGMDIVKKEIIDFMVREKYFTLAQAVSDKFKISLQGITAQIDSEYKEKQAPLLNTRQQHAWLVANIDTLRKKGEREVSIIDAEFKALSSHVDSLLETKKQELLEKATATIKQLIATALDQKASPLAAVKASFGPLSLEMINLLFLQISNGCVKPLKRAIDLPLSQFIKAIEEIQSRNISLVLLKDQLRELKSDNEIPLYNGNFSDESLRVFDTLKTGFLEGLSSKEIRRKRYEEQIIPLAEKQLVKQFEQLALYVKKNIRLICDQCKQDLDFNYKILSDAMENAIANSNELVQEQEPAITSVLQKLSEQKMSFVGIQNKLL
jgi:GTP-binding protein EngB required for normal cell division